MVFSNNLLMGAGGQASGYEIDQSIRFNDNDSAHLARDGFGQSPTSSTVCTISVWVKRGNNLGSNSVIIYGGDPSGSTAESLRFGTGNQLQFSQASSDYDLKTTQLFRDVGAWYHIVAVLNTGAAESSRAALYVNGSQVTDFATENYPGSSYSTNFTANSSSVEHVIGANSTSSQFFDGYIAEFNFIDGQALTAASFGETNADGVWVPKAYSGSYGNNGFFIDGRDSSDLGDDESGNGNDLTASGLTTADQVKDSPTNNLPTFNTLSSGAGTLSDGNLQYVGTSGWTNTRLNLIVPDTGKWALRFKTASSYDQIIVGLCAPDSATTYGDLDVNGVVQIRYNTKDGNFVTRVGGSLVADTGPPTVAAQTFFQLLFDMDNGKMGMAADDATSGTFADISTYSIMDLNGASLSTARQPYAMVYSGTDANAGAILDAGQSGWETTVTGFKNLSLANLATPTITDPSKYFQTTLYNGTGSELEVDQSGENSTFQPDFVWIKNRTNAGNENDLYDAVRGATKAIFSSATNAESTQTQGLKSFDSDGFTVGTRGEVNTSGSTNVAWQWLTNNTTGSTNDDGSVDSTVAVNTTAGFSICKFNPGGNSNITFGHGLGVAPRLVFVKNLEDATNWQVLHLSQGVGNKLFLNTTGAAASDANMWQNTAPTSSVVSVGTSQTTNEQNIAYVWNEVEGYSRFRSFTGNGSTDGPFVYTGFRPALVVVKNITNSGDAWPVADSKRAPFNVSDATVFWNMNNAETTGYSVDLLSNGFKPRSSDHAINESGATIIYMAWAEHPFGGDGIAPSPAR
jgi:hypothetical protein